jgi:hypothetical protein
MIYIMDKNVHAWYSTEFFSHGIRRVKFQRNRQTIDNQVLKNIIQILGKVNFSLFT